MVAETVAAATFVVVLIAEIVHARRVSRVRFLAFGPTGKARLWTRFVPAVRVAAMTAVVWGLTMLFVLPPKVHDRTEQVIKQEPRDLVLVLDVSPSMRLQDAGTDGAVSRSNRAAELLKSFFSRIPMNQFRTTVVACYTGAKPVVERTTDPEVVRNILTDLPMHFAFKAGPTDLISGVEEAARVAGSWRAGTTTLVVVSDGDTIPPTGMPTLPPSIAHVLVIGVGDPSTGKFIDGHQSRQDVSSLRQLATRLGGEYHDGNVQHVSTSLVEDSVKVEDPPQSPVGLLTPREFALIAVVTGTAMLALLPLLLYLMGTRWRPGVLTRPRGKIARNPGRKPAAVA